MTITFAAVTLPFMLRHVLLGELVLAVRRPIITTRHMRNKFTYKWDGPYIVKKFSQLEHTKSSIKKDYELAQSPINFSRSFILNFVL